jgi:hypothetical protein
MCSRILVLCVLLFQTLFLHGQKFALKTNVLYDATTTINAGMEVKLSHKLTLDVSGSYNPWEFSEYRRIKHWMMQPEFRYWPRASFSGHFVGIHGLFSQFNVGNISWMGLEGIRHQGFLYGCGITYGYHWFFTPAFRLEFSLGAGYANLNYEIIESRPCGPSIGRGTKHYFGPTRAGISLIFMLK